MPSKPIRVKIDSTGRVLIPKTIRDMVGITSDSYLLLSISPEGDAISIYRKSNIGGMGKSNIRN